MYAEAKITLLSQTANSVRRVGEWVLIGWDGYGGVDGSEGTTPDKQSYITYYLGP